MEPVTVPRVSFIEPWRDNQEKDGLETIVLSITLILECYVWGKLQSWLENINGKTVNLPSDTCHASEALVGST